MAREIPGQHSDGGDQENHHASAAPVRPGSLKTSVAQSTDH